MLVDRKKDKVKFKIIPKTNEEPNSFKYGGTKIIDSYCFLSSSFDSSVKNLDEDVFNFLKKEFPNNWKFLNKKPAYPHENFNSIDDYQNPVKKLKNDEFLSKLKKMS